MPMMQLNLENLKDLDDGRVSVAFISELRRVVLDCIDRPGDKNARKVTLEFRVVPQIGEDGQCEGADGDFQIKAVIPQRKSKTYGFNVNKRGDLSFSSTSPEDPDQYTFDDLGPDGKVHR